MVLIRLEKLGYGLGAVIIFYSTYAVVNIRVLILFHGFKIKSKPLD
jgi:hypothetical protein